MGGYLPATVLASQMIFLAYCIILTSIVSADRTSSSLVGGSNNGGGGDNNRGKLQQSIPLLSVAGKEAYKRYLRSSVLDNNGGGGGGGPQKVLQLSRSKIPIELDLLLDDDESFDKSKRYDDYGHMRFGKRNGGGEDQFDDYGHMRFGKRGGGGDLF